MKFRRHRHARGILDLRSRCRYLDHDPDAVVFAQWPNRVTPLVVMVGRMGGCWLSENRPRILKRELPSGPRHPAAFGTRRSRSPQPRLSHHPMSITVVLRKLGEDLPPADVRMYATAFEAKCLEVARIALDSTKNIPETV